MINYDTDIVFSSTATVDITEPRVITTFGYPFHYDSNIVLRWSITFEEGRYIRVVFTHIDLNIKKVMIILNILLK